MAKIKYRVCDICGKKIPSLNLTLQELPKDILMVAEFGINYLISWIYAMIVLVKSSNYQ